MDSYGNANKLNQIGYWMVKACLHFCSIRSCEKEWSSWCGYISKLSKYDWQTEFHTINRLCLLHILPPVWNCAFNLLKYVHFLFQLTIKSKFALYISNSVWGYSYSSLQRDKRMQDKYKGKNCDTQMYKITETIKLFLQSASLRICIIHCRACGSSSCFTSCLMRNLDARLAAASLLLSGTNKYVWGWDKTKCSLLEIKLDMLSFIRIVLF